MASVIVMTVYLFFNHPEISKLLQGTSYEEALSVEGTPIFDAIICAVSVTGVIMVELILDIFTDNGLAEIRDQEERVLLLLVIIVPGFLALGYKENPNFPLIYACLHSAQVIGCVTPIYLLCSKLVPKYFTFAKICVSFFCLCVATVLFCVNIGYNRLEVTIFVVVFSCISNGVLTQMIYDWIKGLLTRASERIPISTCRAHSWKDVGSNVIEVMTEDEITCLVYLSLGFFFVLLVSAITAAVHRMCWSTFTVASLCSNIYSFVVFSVLCGVIPGRVRQQASIKANKATVRYISHEIRSPLNIVHNGVKLVIDAVRRSNVYPSDTLEDLQDIYHASSAAVAIVDDLLNFEKIGTKTFSVEKKLKPAVPTFTLMANYCQVYAQNKGISFTVHNLTQEDIYSTYCVSIDCLKMEQVLRNLIVNAVKFTPEGGSININIRHENGPAFPNTSAPKPLQIVGLKVLFCLNLLFWPILVFFRRVKKFPQCFMQKRSRIFVTSVQPKGKVLWSESNCVQGRICVDICDSGAGISESDFNQVFGQFVQFNPNSLQAGGGSGLGLWICREIIKQHGGTISFQSAGQNQGTIFTIKLDCYLQGKEEVSDSDEQYFVGNSHRDAALNYGNACQNKVCTSTPREARCESPQYDKGSRTARVLIVDDGALNRKLMKRLVTMVANNLPPTNELPFSFSFFEADDGCSAVELVRNSPNKFHLIFMDNVMVHMNGPQAVKKMREDGCSALIVGATGNITDADIREFKNHGANVVLKKPVSIEELTSILTNLIVE